MHSLQAVSSQTQTRLISRGLKTDPPAEEHVCICTMYKESNILSCSTKHESICLQATSRFKQATTTGAKKESLTSSNRKILTSLWHRLLRKGLVGGRVSSPSSKAFLAILRSVIVPQVYGLRQADESVTVSRQELDNGTLHSAASLSH